MTALACAFYILLKKSVHLIKNADKQTFDPLERVGLPTDRSGALKQIDNKTGFDQENNIPE